ncbi:MAG TPA: GDSL-type esterase/lipase family protein [Candidatus Binatia bacterium]|nr:GDSL-type esterase/lipase family protein [Candidatus Binatia bacterium]
MRLARALALLLVAAALAEAGLRLARFGPSRAAVGPWSTSPPWERLRRLAPDGTPEPRPGGDAAWSLGAGEPVIGYRLNGAGLRDDREAGPHAPRGSCRVLALGDAYTFGYGVPADAAWPRVLERELGRDAPVEVLNAGFPNLDVEQQERRLRALLPALHPDVVVATFDWWNVPLDRRAARPARWSAAWWLANADEKAARVGTWLGIVHEPLRLLRQASGVFPRSGLARELDPLTAPPEALRDRWLRTETALRAMAADARATGARFALVVTPLDVQVDVRRNALYRRGALPYPAHGFVDIDYSTARAMPDALAAFARDAQLPLLDTTPAFVAGGAHLFLAGDYHAGPDGHAAIAHTIAVWFRTARPCGRAPAEASAR